MRSTIFLSLALVTLPACSGGDDGIRVELDASIDPTKPDAARGDGNGPCVGVDCTELFVAPNGVGGTCMMAAPCGSIQKAIDLRTAQRNFIRVADGAYEESLAIKGGTPVTIRGLGASVRAKYDTSTIDISGEMDVTLVGLDIHGGRGERFDPTERHGIYCALFGGREPRLILEHVTVRDNPGLGVRLGRCSLIVDRSMIRKNGDGGVHMQGKTFTVRNTFIVENGAVSNLGSQGGFNVIGKPEVQSYFEFNTVVGNVSATLGAGVKAVDGPVLFNSNLVGANKFASGLNLDTRFRQFVGGRWSHSLFSGTVVPPETDPDQTTNALTDDPKFVGPGDYHLAAGSPAIDKGGGDNIVDWDGDARPVGSAHDIGADEAR